MILVVVKNPIRPKYADDFPSSSRSSPLRRSRARQHLLRLVSQRRRPEHVRAHRGIRGRGRGRSPRQLRALQEGDRAAPDLLSAIPESSTWRFPADGLAWPRSKARRTPERSGLHGLVGDRASTKACSVFSRGSRCASGPVDVHDEAGLLEERDDRGRAACGRPVERDRVAVGVLEVHAGPADLEREQQRRAGYADPRELGEEVRKSFRRRVDDRVPGHDAGERVVGHVERVDRADVEAQVGIRRPRDAGSSPVRDRYRNPVETRSVCRYAVMRPGPHPRSATCPIPAAGTDSANVPSIARSKGLCASSSRNSSGIIRGNRVVRDSCVVKIGPLVHPPTLRLGSVAVRRRWTSPPRTNSSSSTNASFAANVSVSAPALSNDANST